MDINYEMLLFGAMAVVGLAEWLKSFDTIDKLKKFYAVLPALLAIPVAVIVTVYQKDVWYLGFMNWAILVSMSVLGYTTIVESIKKLTKR